MTTIKPFSLLDSLYFNNINIDQWTETFSTGFYGKYIAKWPECCVSVFGSSGRIKAYLLGKIEGDPKDQAKRSWHGHVSAVTVDPSARRQGYAKLLMKLLEQISNHQAAYFVDLFVRSSNKTAIRMYQDLGYSLYRVVDRYYSGDLEEDAWDMRKSMERDSDGATSRPTGLRITPDKLEFQ